MQSIRLPFRALTRKFSSAVKPAGVSPFRLVLPSHDLKAAQSFYAKTLGLKPVSVSAERVQFSLFGHNLFLEQASADYKAVDYFNPVDHDDVPVPHFGVCLAVDQFHSLAKQLSSVGVKFIVEPHLRFKGAPGEQWTMFFKDPSNNSLEFKAMSNPANLFAKYVVD